MNLTHILNVCRYNGINDFTFGFGDTWILEIQKIYWDTKLFYLVKCYIFGDELVCQCFRMIISAS